MGKTVTTNQKTKNGGSALKRLKASLKDAGVIGPGAKKQRVSKKKSTSKQAAAAGARKEARQTLRDLEAKARDSNPFELKFSRPKHDVLNRKVKGVQGRPGLTKKKGEDARKKTLLVEMQRKNKEASFVDKRFGENDPTMSVEDKMLERFMRERSKRSDRGATFNLEEEELTHFGRSLAGEDAFNDAGLYRVGDESDDDGNIDKDTVKFTHFGGFEEDEVSLKCTCANVVIECNAIQYHGQDPDRKKTKNEVMKEIIAKSKLHKRERQMQKEEDFRIGEQVDAELDSIRHLLNMSTDKGRKLEPLGRVENPITEGEKGGARDDDYDRFVRELAYDRRAKPTDRLKTEEEIAFEEKAKLEKLERDRVRRMMGLPEEEEKFVRKQKPATDKKRAAQADDLEDHDFGDILDAQMADEAETPLVYRNGALVNTHVFMRKKRKIDEDDADDEEEGGGEDGANSDEYGREDDGSDDDGDSDEDGYGEEDVGSEDENGDAGKIAQDALSWDEDTVKTLGAEDDGGWESTSGGEYASDEDANGTDNPSDESTISNVPKLAPDPAELPYTFKAPKTHADFLNLVEDLAIQDQIVVVHRLRVLHSVKLGGNNRVILETIFDVLLEHLDYIASQLPLDLTAVNAYSVPLTELGQQFGEKTTQWAEERVKQIQTKLAKKLAARRQDWPGASEFIFLKLLAHIFSTSDLQHPVITPAMLLIGQYLSQCVIRKGRDAVAGLLLCEIAHEYQTQAKRFVPEAVNFLCKLLKLCVGGETQAPGLLPLVDIDMTVFRIRNFAVEAAPLNFAPLMGKDGPAFDTDEFRLSMAAAASQLLGRFARLYNDTPAFVEVFEPVVQLFDQFPLDQLTGVAQDKISNSRQLIGGLVASSRLKRRPLQLQKRKPVAIKTYIPKFEEHYSVDKKRYDPNRERSEAAKLRFQYKKEFKGAARELRKDAAFVARRRLQEGKEKDAEYKKKMDSIMGQLASQEGAMRGYERELKKKRR
ncbi:nucleolar complex protein 14 [Borealophlyctis nickersoniae]|nr:nucleolar complex protein 14 [Borealophlyctis nickersoniae]